jgi:small subunit ribosomal protein S4e
MSTSHLKRIAAPSSWLIGRKEAKYITRPRPGPHSLQSGISLSTALRELVRIARTAKEVKTIVKNKDVFIDKRKRSDEKYPVGLMDIIELPQLELYYRILLDKKGRLKGVKADAKEANTKLSRIESKSKAKGGKILLGLSDGRSITIDKDGYKIGDTLQLALPDQKITAHLKLEKGAMLLLTGGKHAGQISTVDEISQDKIIIDAGKNQKYEVLKRDAFVIGKEKPALDSIKQLIDKPK